MLEPSIHGIKTVGRAFALVCVWLAATVAAAAATEQSAREGGGAGSDDIPLKQAALSRQEVVIGPQYRASGFHRWLWGNDYRRLWTTPLQAEVLDLHSFAGGLEPRFRVSGQETKALALVGADGRSYTFRGIDKDPTSILPAELQDTWVRNLVQDQIAANHPVAFAVADELMKAAGIPRTEQRLMVMPDDPVLGEFRKDFAGLAGQVYEFPSARDERNPGFLGATELLDHEAFYARMQASPKERPDTRAFLKARLFDILIGDWDRHRDQWRWAKLPDQAAWEPIPEDRDEAFSRFEGLVLALARPRAPRLQNYGASYPAMKGLTWNGWEQDRQLLAGLERPVWKEVALELQGEITDAVIETAARGMPPEYFALDGARLIHDLKGRRDRLPEGADALYAHIADKVRVYLTDGPEYVEVRSLPGGDALVQAWERGPDGGATGQPLYRRTLHGSETDEVQIYLGGGDDRVVSVGRPKVLVRVIGGGGHDVVDDGGGGGTRFSDSVDPELVRGPGSHLDRRTYTPPPPPERAPWIPPRDWGRDTFFSPWLSYGSDLGFFTGIGVDTRSFGFRKHPYASRHILRAGWAFGESSFRADYHADFRSENSRFRAGWYAYGSGVEVSRFFGFGNETSDAGDSKSAFFDAKEDQYSLTPTVTMPLVGDLTFSVGPSMKYSSTRDQDDPTLLNLQRPYGFGDFGQVGATGVLELDTRVPAPHAPGGKALDRMGYPRAGALVSVRGQVWPAVWDVEETFGSVDGSAAVYLTPGGSRAPTLALRAGGRKVWGTYPFFEASYVGGGLGGFGPAAGDEPVRGLPRHRYAGDGALYGNADLRLPISRMRIGLPGEWGVFGFGDAGRVYLDGESSDEWHYGGGGGLWFAWLDRANTLSLSYARSEGQNAFYFRGGFAF